MNILIHWLLENIRRGYAVAINKFYLLAVILNVAAMLLFVASMAIVFNLPELLNIVIKMIVGYLGVLLVCVVAHNTRRNKKSV